MQCSIETYQCQQKCPHFVLGIQSLDSRLLENNMPYFPILDVHWTWALSPKRIVTNLNQPRQHQQPNQTQPPPPPPPPSNNSGSWNQNLCQPPPLLPNSQHPSQQPASHTQTMLNMVPSYLQQDAPQGMSWQLIQHPPAQPLPPHLQQNPVQPPPGSIPQGFYNGNYIGSDPNYWTPTWVDGQPQHHHHSVYGSKMLENCKQHTNTFSLQTHLFMTSFSYRNPGSITLGNPEVATTGKCYTQATIIKMAEPM